MSILIKGMEMPKGCATCPYCDRAWNKPKCKAKSVQGRFMEQRLNLDRTRQKWCPLVPIPPHGDLIDRNKLYEKTAEWEAQALHMVEVTMNDEDTTEWRKWSTVLTERSAFKFDIADAPTILEAEGEDNG